MALTLSILQTRVRRAMRQMNTAGYKEVSKAHMRHIVNQAQQLVRIEAMDRCEQYSGTFTANQRDHSLPTDFLKEYRIFVSPSGTFQGYPMVAKPYEDLVPITTRLDSIPQAVRGDGTDYYYYSISSDRVIYVQPIFSTATAFHLFYYSLPSDMTSPSDTPDMEENLHELVYLKACILVASDIGNFQQYQERQKIYSDHLRYLMPFINAKQSHLTIPARSY